MRAAAVTCALVACVGAAGADERGYELRNADGVKRPAPLVVLLHCYGCPTTVLGRALGIDAVAKRHGFVVAVPAGRTDAHGHPFWNATPACCDFDGKKPDDVGYVRRVIDELVKKGLADPKRVYLVGVSNGGFLAHRLACELAPKIAAVVSIAGAGPEPALCKPKEPVAVLAIHGDADEIVPLEGGGIGGNLPQRALVPSTRATLSQWARLDGCDGEAMTEAPIDLDARATGAETRVDRWHCPAAAVELWTIHGGGHVPEFNAETGERIWHWLAAQHK